MKIKGAIPDEDRDQTPKLTFRKIPIIFSVSRRFNMPHDKEDIPKDPEDISQNTQTISHDEEKG